ncbi:MAG: DUF4252 domain-containing protein [Saprospiraceae bacterium]|nr:DUF4252 domain-containing protein [Saprospiraceae bacterium]MCB9322224.1 DUF4252 domain-containing protein [Lewinellaceae bacterium]
MNFKKISLSTLFFLGVALMVNAQSNAIDTYFKQYVDDERFTVVYISPKFFNIMDKVFSNLNLEEGDVDKDELAAVMEIAKDMKELRILTTDVTPDVFYNEARKKINTKDYEVLMTVRTKEKQNVEIFIKQGPDESIREMLLFAGGGTGGDEDTDFAIISFVGNIQLEKVSNFINKIDK